MQTAIDAYFDSVPDGRVPTTTGLALAIGFNSRQSLLNYEEKPAFVDTIKRAKLRLEAAIEDALVNRNGSVTGLIFNLKNNYGWKDAQDINHGFDDLRVIVDVRR